MIALSAFNTSCAKPPSASAQQAVSTKKSWVSFIAKAQPEDVEKILGKAVKKSGSGDEFIYEYAPKGKSKVAVTYNTYFDSKRGVKGTLRAGGIEIRLRKPCRTWKEAFQSVGIETAGVVAHPKSPEILKGVSGLPEKAFCAFFDPKKPTTLEFNHLGRYPGEIMQWVREPVSQTMAEAPPTNNSGEGMAKTAFGKKLWSVIGGTQNNLKETFGNPDGKDRRYGPGYIIPGFDSYRQQRFLRFSDKEPVVATGTLEMSDLGKTRASTIFEKLGWDISKWKSIKRILEEDGDYEETLEYAGIQILIHVPAYNHSMGDRYFIIRKI